MHSATAACDVASVTLAVSSALAASTADAHAPSFPAAQVKCHACVGGTSVREDARILQAGVHVIVGTPGRVFDMLRRRYLRPDSIKMFVLDEADEMLSRGFKDQIYDIFQQLPPKMQVRPPKRAARSIVRPDALTGESHIGVCPAHW